MTDTLYDKPRPSNGIPWGKLAAHIVLLLGSFIMVLPFLWMVSTSLKTSTDILREFPPRLIPSTFMISNYATALNSLPFDRYFFNSLLVATSVTLLQLLTSSLAAYAFARLRFKGRDTIFFLYLIGLMIPFPVLLLPNFLMIRQLGWFDSYLALIVPPAFSAFSIFLLRQYYRGIPLDYDESARIDGASSLRIWWSILLPNSRPALAALAVFTFLGTWNDFLWPLVVTNSESMRTLPVGLSTFQGQFTVRWELLMAGSVVALIPVLIVYFFAQNWIIKGLSVSSGLKG
ncbi:MAG: carbohydrate ABC transporter permease [Chloroflexi bacterium]|nr:carbohydrate ABC transporter permease [Chloroflexota bacterium]MCC6895696.1 carbohydrate ABC transporter permease [Anaerolineae bacterium]